MGFSGKLIGAGLGFLLGGGPLGAVLGGIIGHFVKDRPLSDEVANDPEFQRQQKEFFFVANLVGIIAGVLKADGEIREEEVKAVRRFFSERLGYNEESLEVVRKMLKEFLDQPIDIDALCADFKAKTDYSARLLLVECLEEIAFADGHLHASEMAVIDRVVMLLGVSDADRRRTSRSTNVLNKGDYEVLGVEHGASKEEIRRAYLELVKKYHPDRVAHLGEEFKELAHKKFVELQAAYERLSAKT